MPIKYRAHSQVVRCRNGNAVVEYVVVLSLIVVACLGSLQALGINVQRTLGLTIQALNSGGNNGPPTGSGQVQDPGQHE